MSPETKFKVTSASHVGLTNFSRVQLQSEPDKLSKTKHIEAAYINHLFWAAYSNPWRAFKSISRKAITSSITSGPSAGLRYIDALAHCSVFFCLPREMTLPAHSPPEIHPKSGQHKRISLGIPCKPPQLGTSSISLNPIHIPSFSVVNWSDPASARLDGKDLESNSPQRRRRTSMIWRRIKVHLVRYVFGIQLRTCNDTSLLYKCFIS